MSGPDDRHGLEVLDFAQCLALLRSRPLGRLAYIEAGAPVVVPVNHVLDGSSVIIRTVLGGKLDAAIVGQPVAFQLDDHDAARGTGWSVLVKGRAVLVDDEDRTGRYAEALDSWAVQPGDDTAWIRVVADEVSGRRLSRA